MAASDAFQDWRRSNQRLRSSLPARKTELQEVDTLLGHRLPEPLRQCLLIDGSPEGFWGESYIAFFSARDIAMSWHQSQEAAAGMATRGMLFWTC